MITAGEAAEYTLAETYHTQVAEQFAAAQEALCMSEMLLLCLTVREQWPTAKYIEVNESDQGPYVIGVGVYETLPTTADEVRDLNLDDESQGWGFDYQYNLDERDETIWSVFLERREVDGFGGAWLHVFLDIERVLAVPMPWRPVEQGVSL